MKNAVNSTNVNDFGGGLTEQTPFHEQSVASDIT